MIKLIFKIFIFKKLKKIWFVFRGTYCLSWQSQRVMYRKKNKSYFFKFMFFILLLNSKAYCLGVDADTKEAQLEIRAKVPSFCNLKVDYSPLQKNLSLETGNYKVLAANLLVKCNIYNGYKIILNSENNFNLINSASEDKTDILPYRVEINGFSESKSAGNNYLEFRPLGKKLDYEYQAYINYDVLSEVEASEYKDVLLFRLEVD